MRDVNVRVDPEQERFERLLSRLWWRRVRREIYSALPLAFLLVLIAWLMVEALR